MIMALSLEEYLKRINKTSEVRREYVGYLKMVCSEEALNIMWQTFALQCNEAMNGNESVDNAKEVHDLSIRYLSALVICQMLFTRYNSATRSIYNLKDFKELKKSDITETIQKVITEKRMFEHLNKEERKDKIEELLKSIQEPIDQKDQDNKIILEHIIQRHCEIIYTSMLLSNYEYRDRFCIAVKSVFLCSKENVDSIANKYVVTGYGDDFKTLKSFLCLNLYNTLNEFHTYLAEISNKEEQ